jgi:hypothetical protein
VVQDLIDSINYFIFNVETYLFLFFIFLIFCIHKLVINKEIKIINLIKYYFLFSYLIIFLSMLPSLVKQNFFNIENKRLLRDSLFFYGDTFADGVKVLFSYTHIFNSDKIEFFTNIFSENPYLNIIPDTSYMLNIHTVPIVTIKFNLVANLLNLLNFSYLYIVVFYFLVYLILVIKNYFLIKDISLNYANIFLTLSIFSYPVLFLYQRGNFTAGFAFQLLIMSYLIFRGKNKKDYKSLILLLIALSMRPNYIVVLPIFYIGDTLKTQIKEIFKIIFIFIFSNLIFIRLANLLYKEYSLLGMLAGFRQIRDSHIFSGDGFDSSMFRIIQRLFDPDGLHLNPWYNLTLVFGVFILIYLFFNQQINIQLKVFLLTMSSLVFSFPIADYHLPVLILVILYILFKNEIIKMDILLIILILIILFPIPHFISKLPSISNFLNVAIYVYTLTISINKKFYKNLLSSVN